MTELKTSNLFWHGIASASVIMAALVGCVLVVSYNSGVVRDIALFVNGASFASAVLSLLYVRQVQRAQKAFDQALSDAADSMFAEVPGFVNQILDQMKRDGVIPDSVHVGPAFVRPGRERDKMN